MQNVQDEIFQLIEAWDMKVLSGAREQLGQLRTLMLSVECSFNEVMIGAIVLLKDADFFPSQQGADTDNRLSSVLSRLFQFCTELTRQNQRLEMFPLSSFENALPELQQCHAQPSRLGASMDLTVATVALQELYAYLKSVHMAYDCR